MSRYNQPNALSPIFDTERQYGSISVGNTPPGPVPPPPPLFAMFVGASNNGAGGSQNVPYPTENSYSPAAGDLAVVFVTSRGTGGSITGWSSYGLDANYGTLVYNTLAGTEGSTELLVCADFHSACMVVVRGGSAFGTVGTNTTSGTGATTWPSTTPASAPAILLLTTLSRFGGSGAMGPPTGGTEPVVEIKNNNSESPFGSIGVWLVEMFAGGTEGPWTADGSGFNNIRNSAVLPVLL